MNLNERNELIDKMTRYITELQSARYMLLDGKNRDEILTITKIDIAILNNLGNQFI